MFHLPDLAVLIPYTIAAIVVVIVPGITVSTVVSTALAGGMAAAYWFELGANLARFSMVLVVALGLEVVTGVVSFLFDPIKYLGAAYLAYVGIGYLRARGGIALNRERSERSAARLVLGGFLTLWGNPKALLFFGAFIPQFVDPDYPAAPQVVLLGLIEIAVAIIADSVYILLAVGARSLLTGQGVVWVNRIAGVILIGAAIWLATQHR